MTATLQAPATAPELRRRHVAAGLSASVLAGPSGPDRTGPALFPAVITTFSVSFILRSSR